MPASVQRTGHRCRHVPPSPPPSRAQPPRALHPRTRAPRRQLPLICSPRPAAGHRAGPRPRRAGPATSREAAHLLRGHSKPSADGRRGRSHPDRPRLRLPRLGGPLTTSEPPAGTADHNPSTACRRPSRPWQSPLDWHGAAPTFTAINPVQPPGGCARPSPERRTDGRCRHPNPAQARHCRAGQHPERPGPPRHPHRRDRSRPPVHRRHAARRGQRLRQPYRSHGRLARQPRSGCRHHPRRGHPCRDRRRSGRTRLLVPESALSPRSRRRGAPCSGRRPPDRQ